MAKFLDGYKTAMDVAVGLDAFRTEVADGNPEYTRGIVELIAYAYVDTEDDYDHGSDYLRDKIMAHGRALTAAFDAENKIKGL